MRGEWRAFLILLLTHWELQSPPRSRRGTAFPAGGPSSKGSSGVTVFPFTEAPLIPLRT